MNRYLERFSWPSLDDCLKNCALCQQELSIESNCSSFVVIDGETSFQNVDVVDCKNQACEQVRRFFGISEVDEHSIAKSINGELILDSSIKRRRRSARARGFVNFLFGVCGL